MRLRFSIRPYLVGHLSSGISHLSERWLLTSLDHVLRHAPTSQRFHFNDINLDAAFFRAQLSRHATLPPGSQPDLATLQPHLHSHLTNPSAPNPISPADQQPPHGQLRKFPRLAARLTFPQDGACSSDGVALCLRVRRSCLTCLLVLCGSRPFSVASCTVRVRWAA